MRKILEFFKSEPVTAWMLTFLIIFYATLFLTTTVHKKNLDGSKQVAATHRMTPEQFKSKEAVFQKTLQGRPRLLAGVALSFTGVLFLGLGLNLYFLQQKLKGRVLLSRTLEHEAVPWGGKAVLQVFVWLFFLDTLFHLLFFSSNFTLMVNSLLRDILVAAFVIFLVKQKFRRPLADLGLTPKKLFQNIWRGFVAYVAVIPLLLLILFLMSAIAQVFSYEPPPQAVVEIYLKETKGNNILFFTFFVALLGPAIEEIFFRGFTYKAFRARWGVRFAMLASALIFALLHMSLVAFLPIFVLGLFLAYLYEKSGSLVPSMTVHMLHNLIMVSLTLGFKALSA